MMAAASLCEGTAQLQAILGAAHPIHCSTVRWEVPAIVAQLCSFRIAEDELAHDHHLGRAHDTACSQPDLPSPSWSLHMLCEAPCFRPAHARALPPGRGQHSWPPGVSHSAPAPAASQDWHTRCHTCTLASTSMRIRAASGRVLSPTRCTGRSPNLLRTRSPSAYCAISSCTCGPRAHQHTGQAGDISPRLLKWRPRMPCAGEGLHRCPWPSRREGLASRCT